MRACQMLFAVLVCAGPAAAQVGPDFAWFTLEGGDCTGIEVLSEGPGAALVIEKDAAATCTLQIGYNLTATNSGQPTTLESWSFSLDGGDSDLVVAKPGGDGLVWFYSNGYDIHYGSPGVNDDLLFNFGQESFDGIGATGLVGILYLQITKDGLADVHDIFGEIGPIGSQIAGGAFWSGRVGPNGLISGAANTSFGTLPVISIRNVPEPASAIILGAGLALCRRVRGRD